MKIHVLGCFGPYPAPGEATSGYLVEAAGKCICWIAVPVLPEN